MKTYGNVLAFTEPKTNLPKYGDVMDTDKFMTYQGIHSYKVQQNQDQITPTVRPDIIKPKTKAQKEEELRELMGLFYQVKTNEMKQNGLITPAFNPDPYSTDFNYINNTSYSRKSGVLKTAEQYSQMYANKSKATGTTQTGVSSGASQIPPPPFGTPSVRGSVDTMNQRLFNQSGGEFGRPRSKSVDTVTQQEPLVRSRLRGQQPVAVPAGGGGGGEFFF